MEILDEGFEKRKLSLQRMVAMLASMLMMIFFIFPGLIVLKSIFVAKVALAVLVILHGACGILWWKKDLVAAAHSFAAVIVYVCIYSLAF